MNRVKKEQVKQMKSKSSSTVTLRAIIIGLILLPLNAYWIGASSELWYSLHMTSASLFFNAVFNLFFLALLNLCLRKFLPSFALSQAELLAIYTMLVMLSTVCGHAMMCFLLGTLAHPFWFATVENEYAELFHRYIPQWFTVRDEKILSGFFEGNSTFYAAEHIRAWLSPVLLWSTITFALFFLFMCMSIVIRKQWTEKEKLSYPIVRLPIEMTAPGFFWSKLMWMGFAIAASIDIVNGLHFLYPTVPHIPIKNYGINFFTEKPWNAFGALNVSFYPFVIGLTFFVPLDMSFSVWFFYLFVRAQRIIGSIFGLRALPGFPYINEQGEGAWIVLGLLALWASRFHLKQVLKRIFLSKSQVDDSEEPLGYRSAVLSIIVGIIFLTLLLYKAGMSLSAIVFYFAIFFAMSIAITRVRATVGPPIHEVIYMHPQGVMMKALGTRRVGGANMTILSFLYPFNRDNAAHPMPSQLEGFKIAEQTRMNNKQLMWAMVLALAISVLASFWIYLQMMYEYGASAKARGYVAGIGRETFGQLSSWMQYPRGVDYPAVTVMGAASLFTIFLMIMSRRFIWWPFHPAGYALGTSAGTGWFWAAVLAGWVIKMVILRYGGLKAYRRSVPFFLGLILGEYVVGCSLSAIGVVFGIPTYRVWS